MPYKMHFFFVDDLGTIQYFHQRAVMFSPRSMGMMNILKEDDWEGSWPVCK